MTDVRYDAQIFEAQRRGGISRYFVELMRQFDHDPALGVTVSTPFRRIRNEHLAEAYPGRYKVAPPLGRVRRLLERPFRPDDPAAELVHLTYYDRAALDAARGLPVVSTVHDMIPELFPHEFPAGNPHLDKEACVGASAGLVCVSETTRRDLLALYGELAGDVVVIPHGVGDEFRTPARPRVRLPDSYVLYVGRRGGYKDWAVVVDAFASGALGAGVSLVCLGGGAFTADERALLTERGVAARTHLLRVPDSDLPGVYAAAAAFAFPSRYEGFGLPVLEAFAAGCPVVVADTDCSREVADDAARYFAAGDADALADALGALLRDDSARDRLVAAGRRRAAGFTWRRTAEATAAFYREVAA